LIEYERTKEVVFDSDYNVEDIVKILKENGINCWLSEGKETEFSEKTMEDSK